MLFFPYQIDLDIKGTPYLTWAVCVLCVLVFIYHQGSLRTHVKEIGSFCSTQLSPEEKDILEGPGERGCPWTLYDMLNWPSGQDGHIADLVEKSVPEEREQVEKTLRDLVQRARDTIPPSAINRWKYYPDDMNPVRMLSSNLSHADWEHLGFNLVFFFAFAAAVELTLGRFFFLLIFLLTSAVTGLSYSLGLFGFANQWPSLGLSDVVMGYMATIAVLYPHKMVRVFYWVIIHAGIFRVPLLLLVGTFVGLDVYALGDSEQGVNYLAHVMGAFTGGLVAIAALLFCKGRIRQYY